MYAHIDADLIVYRAGFAAEKAHYYVEHDGVYYSFEKKVDANAFCDEIGYERADIQQERNPEPVENAIYNAKSMIRECLKQAEADEYCLYLSGSTNFRDEVAVSKPYKGNRDELHKPVHGPAIREWMMSQHPHNLSDNEEADDVVSYRHYQMWVENPAETLLCSVDKDLRMVPGMHYNFIKDEFVVVSAADGLRRFCTQLLTGDSTDNIPGLPGIGPTKAERILLEDDTPRLWMQHVIAAYDKAGFDEDYLIEQGRLLWMRRAPQEMWTPGLEYDYYLMDKDNEEALL